MSCVMDLLLRLPARLRANDPEPESYETKVRVLSVLCLCILAVAPMTGGIYMCIDRPPSPLPVGYFFLQAAMVIWPGTWISVLVWGLVAGQTYPKMMDAMIGGSMLAAFCAAFGSPQFDTTYLTMTLFAGTALVIGTTWWKAWYILSHVLGILQAYNRLAFHAGWTLASGDPFRLEDISTMSYAISTGGYFMGGVILCATLVLQRAEHVRATEAAVAAEEVTVTIAGKLQVYDTAAAAEALKHEAAAGVDKELKAAFTALVANLESYRPYLPNWLLATTDEDMDGDNKNEKEVDETSESELSTDDGSSRRSSSRHRSKVALQRKSGAFGSQGKLSRVTDDGMHSIDVLSVDSSPSGRSGNTYRSGNDRHTGRSFDASGQHDRDQDEAEVGVRRHSGGVGQTRASALEKRSYLKGTVTFAVVEYVTEDVPDASLSETLTAVADAVHRCAAECKGAVHTMLLGEIVVSWNVATRVAGPEAKAAKFLLSLKRAFALALDIDPAFKAVAAAASHHARSETIGTIKKLLTSERIGSLRPKLRGICRFAWSTWAASHDASSTPCPLGTSLSLPPATPTPSSTSPSLPPQRARGSVNMVSPLSVILLDERTMREAATNFIISAGAVLDVSGHLPMRKSPKPHVVAGQAVVSGHASFDNTIRTGPSEMEAVQTVPETVSMASMRVLGREHSSTPHGHATPPPQLKPSGSGGAGNGGKGNGIEAEFRGVVDPHNAPGVVPSLLMEGNRSITSEPPSLPSARSADAPVRRSPPPPGHIPDRAGTSKPHVNAGGRSHGLVHVFDLVSARTGDDDEWLYAMEEGAADAARAAQLMVGAGLRRQSGGVDAAAVRAAFEEAGKQRDGACIMARPLVRQLVDGITSVPTKA